jgi:hypothetical protein
VTLGVSHLPHRAATPPTPNEYDALKMRAPVVHTNQEVVNYNKIELTNIVEQRQISCYNKSMEKCIDEWFLTYFHQDWYGTVLSTKNKPVVLM